MFVGINRTFKRYFSILGKIPANELLQRRLNFSKLFDFFPSNQDNQIFVFFPPSKTFSHHHIENQFFPDTYSYYLSNNKIPSSYFIVDRINGKYSYKIFIKEQSQTEELWCGKQKSSEEISDLTCCSVHYLDGMHDYLSEFKSKGSFNLWMRYFNFIQDQSNNPYLETIKGVLETLGVSLKDVRDPTKYLDQLRVVKSNYEINCIQNACLLSDNLLDECLQHKEWDNEKNFHDFIDNFYRINNSQISFQPIVASGNNGTTIHYSNNNEKIKDESLILIDTGCWFEGYSSDITRTLPIRKGAFNLHQRILYDVVSEVHKICVKHIENNLATNFHDLNVLMYKLVGNFLLEESIIDSDHKTPEFIKLVCPHGIGHFLGLDVHDCGTIGRDIELPQDSVFTIEPGIYINKNNMNMNFIRKEFHGIAVRIENDYHLSYKDGKRKLQCLNKFPYKSIDIEEKMKNFV